ncbi:MAG: hypothetical protein NVSMB6_00680 [Burkholderiaceae bacterium]
MIFCVEWNVNPLSEFDQFHIDTLEKIGEKNRNMLAKGMLPTYFVIGHAPTFPQARELAAEYKASRQP